MNKPKTVVDATGKKVSREELAEALGIDPSQLEEVIPVTPGTQEFRLVSGTKINTKGIEAPKLEPEIASASTEEELFDWFKVGVIEMKLNPNGTAEGRFFTSKSFANLEEDDTVESYARKLAVVNDLIAHMICMRTQFIIGRNQLKRRARKAA